VDTSTLIRPDGHLLPQRAKGDSTGESDIKIEGYSRKAILNKDLEVVGEKYLHGKNVLIGDKTAIDIFGDSDVVGRNFEISLNSGKKVELRVIGVYKEELGDTFGIPSIYIDLDEYKNIIMNMNITNLVVAYDEKEGIEEATHYVIQMLSRKNYRNKYSVLEGNSRYRKIEKIKDMLNMFLGAVGVVALVMGGLGISNLLMNMIREMTPSIGILRTMGISANDILKIFLLQSTILSTLGGGIGIILGCVGAYVVGRVIDIPSVYNLSQISLVFFTSVIMGIGFGTVPAWKAAKMEVVEALKI
jgi:putative ABC transport system permease protein